MEEGKNLLNEVAAESYDASEKPFDFVETDAETALVCEPNDTIGENISNALKNLGYQVTKVSSTFEALKRMRFHLYDVIIVNEILDSQTPDKNDVLAYLETLSMTTRRQIFVALLSNKYRTMDNMSAFQRSVNVTVNMTNIADIGAIVKKAAADNADFYHVFREVLRKKGRL